MSALGQHDPWRPERLSYPRWKRSPGSLLRPTLGLGVCRVGADSHLHPALMVPSSTLEALEALQGRRKWGALGTRTTRSHGQWKGYQVVALHKGETCRGVCPGPAVPRCDTVDVSCLWSGRATEAAGSVLFASPPAHQPWAFCSPGYRLGLAVRMTGSQMGRECTTTLALPRPLPPR